jgi:cobalamin biosynthesis Co2+ chelatase CbiK
MRNKKVKNIEIVPFYVKNGKLQNNAMHFSERNSLKKMHQNQIKKISSPCTK